MQKKMQNLILLILQRDDIMSSLFINFINGLHGCYSITCNVLQQPEEQDFYHNIYY